MNWQKFVSILKKWTFLPPVPTVLISIPSFGLVIWALVCVPENEAIAYAAYVLSAYALIITVTGIVRLVRWIRAGAREHPTVRRVMSISLVDRYLKEKNYRAEISLYPGLLINLIYAGIKMFSGIRYRSVWFGTLAVYYILLAVMRFFLLQHMRTKNIRKEEKTEALRRCRWCGIVLLVLNWALAGMIILVVLKDSGFTYPGMLIYVMAMYTFYSVITAAKNMIQFRAYGNPVLSAAKVISMTAALVSMLSLETAMLTQFGTGEDPVFRQLMTAVTGAGVIAIVLAMAISMIVKSTAQMRKMKEQEECVND